jgi:hypothetical protein
MFDRPIIYPFKKTISVMPKLKDYHFMAFEM